MNTKLIASGAVVALLAMSMTASAYHITGTVPPQTLPLPFPVAGSAHTWTAQTNLFSPVDEPCNNQTPLAGGFTIESLWDLIRTTLAGLHALIAGIFEDFFTQDGCIFVDPGMREGDNILAIIPSCETDDQGFGFPEPIPGPGLGGLCSMSPGYVDVDDADADMIPNNGCNYVGDGVGAGRSTGQGPNYDDTITGSGTSCEDASSVYGPGLGVNAGQDFYGVVKVPAHDFFEFTMDGHDFIMQVNGIGCDTKADNAIVGMQYAYATDGGHVTGFVVEDVAIGTYQVNDLGNTFPPAGATACITGTAAPLYY